MNSSPPPEVAKSIPSINAYNLAHQVRELLDAIGEGGELTPEQDALFDNLSENADSFIQYLCEALQERNATSTALRSIAAQFTVKARGHEDACYRLRRCILSTMKLLGVKAHKTTLFSILVKNSPPKVVVDVELDFSKISESLVRIEKSLDNEAVKTLALTEPDKLPEGVKVVQDQHVQVTPR